MRPLRNRATQISKSAARLALALALLATPLWVSGLAGCRSTEESEPTPALADDAEARSLLGRVLRSPELPADVLSDRREKLEAARRIYESRPNDLEALIWYGRRTAYLGEYRNAIAIYTGGLHSHPDQPKLYRHRGHRYLTLRRFDDAIWDLERAARLVDGLPDEIEPDGLPNARNEPTSTLQSNIWYHLGLAHFVTDRLERALEAYQQCIAVSRNPDMTCATTHWLYMTLRRLGRDDDAKRALLPISADMDIIENHGYHRLLLLYKGEVSADEIEAEFRSDEGSIESASVGYGLANWYRLEGEEERGTAILEELADNDQWAAFGVIAAEADLAREQR